MSKCSLSQGCNERIRDASSESPARTAPRSCGPPGRLAISDDDWAATSETCTLRQGLFLGDWLGRVFRNFATMSIKQEWRAAKKEHECPPSPRAKDCLRRPEKQTIREQKNRATGVRQGFGCSRRSDYDFPGRYTASLDTSFVSFLQVSVGE
jgi:hypothetical protein